jgi:hypothetical protein
MRNAIVVMMTTALVSPAAADWQYSRWGMTVDQVATASKGQLRPCTPALCDKKWTDNEEARLTGDYRSGEFKFSAAAFFSKKAVKLEWVDLELKQADQGNALLGALRSKYGEPASRSVTQIMRIEVWRDGKDQVSFVGLGIGGNFSSVSVIYRPRVTESNKGL